MTYLIAGTIIFFGIHFIPATSLKTLVTEKYGLNPYKGMISLFSAIGLGLIVYGLGNTPFQPLWQPPHWSRTALIFIMPISIILVCAGNMPTNIKRWVRHPMLLGTCLWGIGHLIANGDLATTVLFLSFVTYSILNIFMVNARGGYEPPAAISPLWDIATIVIGLGAYAGLFYAHGWFTGMPLM